MKAAREFGFMMDNNATNTFVIGTGLEDLQDLAQIKYVIPQKTAYCN